MHGKVGIAEAILKEPTVQYVVNYNVSYKKLS